jgi:metal-dependent amidase/aminoacylase/carboxypeptidase family protein
VLSVTRIVGGDAYNVIPQSAKMSGTARAFKPAVMQLIESRLTQIAKGVAHGFGAEAEVDFRQIFAPLINAATETDVIADAAAALVGESNVDRAKPPSMGSEDFSFMMEQVPGAYIQLGNGDSADLHNPAYNFNDEATPYGAALLATLIERQMGGQSGTAANPKPLACVSDCDQRFFGLADFLAVAVTGAWPCS